MYKLTFYYKNGMLFGRFIDHKGNVTNLDTSKCLDLINGLKEEINLIKNVRQDNSMHFEIGNVEVTLRNIKMFS